MTNRMNEQGAMLNQRSGQASDLKVCAERQNIILAVAGLGTKVRVRIDKASNVGVSVALRS